MKLWQTRLRRAPREWPRCPAFKGDADIALLARKYQSYEYMPWASRAAARSTAATRRCLCGAIPSLISARISAGAVSGEPAWKGGAGLYSSLSWIASAVLRSIISETRVNAKSIPAVTPPPVTRLRSTQTRALVGVAPKGARQSMADQCVVAR